MATKSDHCEEQQVGRIPKRRTVLWHRVLGSRRPGGEGDPEEPMDIGGPRDAPFAGGWGRRAARRGGRRRSGCRRRTSLKGPEVAQRTVHLDSHLVGTPAACGLQRRGSRVHDMDPAAVRKKRPPPPRPRCEESARRPPAHARRHNRRAGDGTSRGRPPRTVALRRMRRRMLSQAREQGSCSISLPRVHMDLTPEEPMDEAARVIE